MEWAGEGKEVEIVRKGKEWVGTGMEWAGEGKEG